VSEDHVFEDEGFLEIEAELTDPRDERVSPWILSAAVIGLLIGFFFWGSLVMSVASAAGDFFDGDSTTNNGSIAAGDTVTTVSTPTPQPSATTTPDAGVNRLDCTEIRGTDYRSPEERTWFLANCVTR
jgi:hypothetical protein